MARLTVLDLRGDRSDPRDRIPRPRDQVAAATDVVRDVLAAVRERGDDEVRELTARFDGVELDDLRVPQPVLDAALERPRPGPARRHRPRRRAGALVPRAGGTDRLGGDPRRGADGAVAPSRSSASACTSPGGKAAYPSTVIMTVVPAQVAGVDEVVLCVPSDGRRRRCRTGPCWRPRRSSASTSVFRIGGAQAIAAMAYGTASVPACDKVVGPGNVYVALAKAQVQAEGVCGIDSIAGSDRDRHRRRPHRRPAGRRRRPRLAGRARRTRQRRSSSPRTRSWSRRSKRRSRTRSRPPSTASASRQRWRGRARSCSSTTSTTRSQVAEAYAAEHLEVQTVDAAAVAERIRYAGTTFIGPTRPVSLGDYAAGPNHTLPVLGTARFTGGLTTASATSCPVNYVEVTRDALADLAAVGPAARRRRGPAGARPRGRRAPRRAGRDAMEPTQRLPAPRRPRRRDPVRRAAARRARAAQHQRDRRAAAARLPRRGRPPHPGASSSTATRTGPTRALRDGARGAVRARPRPGVGRQRLQRGPAAAAPGLRRARTGGC